jgi:hypothetical protein
VKIAEKFDEEKFSKEFLPKLRKALDDVAVDKKKIFYPDDCRKAIKAFTKNKFFENVEHIQQYRVFIGVGPYFGWKDTYRESIPNSVLWVVVPDNNASCTLYYLPFNKTAETIFHGESRLDYNSGMVGFQESPSLKQIMDENGSDGEETVALYLSLLNYVREMSSSAVFFLSFLDGDGEEINSQPSYRLPPLCSVYPSFNLYYAGKEAKTFNRVIAFAPGFLRVDFITYNNPQANLFLDTKGHETRIDLELDADDLQKVDSMNFEVSFEKW